MKRGRISILFKIVVSILLIINIINPNLSWKMKEGWISKDAKPSNSYLVMTRIFSFILLFVLWVFV